MRTRRDTPIFLIYLDNVVPYYYFYLIPLMIALIFVSFDFNFSGLLHTTMVTKLSNQHKFLNDFFAICTLITLILCFFNYLVITLNAIQRKNLRLYYSKFNPKYRVFFGILGIIFFLFILFFMCLSWFLLDDRMPDFSKKGAYFTYLRQFSQPYISAIIMSLQYLLCVFFALYFLFILNVRKYCRQ